MQTITKPGTLKDLRDSGWQSKAVKDEIRDNFNKIYDELDMARQQADQKKERYAALETMICGFGEKVDAITPRPTSDLTVIKSAIDQIKDQLEQCYAGSYSDDMLRKLDDLSIVANPDLDACGQTTFWGFLTNEIQINPIAILDPGTSVECCAPAGLIVHEMSHLFLRGRLPGHSESFALGIEHECFGCEDSTIMRDYLERQRRYQERLSHPLLH